METTQVKLHDKVFNVEKRNGEWQTNYRDAKATIGSTKADAINNLKAMDRDTILTACDSMDKTIGRDIYFKEHTDTFRHIFGFAPPRDFLMYAMGCGLCLDVIALDKKLRVPDGISTNDYILTQYGEEAVTMVQKMI